MSVIRILPEAVANKIAAGEVVERPASVVKELVENSLDAGAGRVEVALEAGGKRLIRIADNGCGMTHDDALLAFERHATSKIRSAEDLFDVSTLGFRGEALPSIAAVSRLELQTRHTSESAGTRVEIAGGRLRDVKEVSWAGGTQVEVRDLFFNTPARRKFLKSESTELGHIATFVTHYALAHPQTCFRLSSFSNEILNAAPVATARERVYQVLGGQVLEQLVELSPVERRFPAAPPAGLEDEGQPEESGLARVTGFVSRPEIQRLNRSQIYFFVNRRLVRDRLILHAITEAYRNILPASVFPVALIFLELPTAEVDVNVHPSKTEVRFRHTGFIHDLVRDSIRQALVAARPVAAFPLPRERRARADLVAVEAAEKLADEPPLIRGPDEGLPRGAEPSRRTPGDAFRLSPPERVPETGKLPLAGEPSGPQGAQGLPPSLSEAALFVYSPTGPAEDAAPMADRSGASEFPNDLLPLGQVQESFIVATNAEGLWLVDQHAAHERVLFERHLRQRRERRVEGQRLLLPIVVELKPGQQVVFQEIAEELAANGFEVEPFGQRTVTVKTAPAEVRSEDVERLLLEILDSVGSEAKKLSLEVLRARIAASVSCHAAIKVNMPLDRAKMDWLLRSLARAEYPMTCPHGRPIVLRYGLKELLKAFKRI
ncbi:MAG: DNA mismatch repair endonuclease MutL [Acidobacteriia bacterium]|nr:DNA mismatch repair endonuclease MutL [Terriglobia bacterium]